MKGLNEMFRFPQHDPSGQILRFPFAPLRAETQNDTIRFFQQSQKNMVSVLLVNTNLIKPPIAPIGLDYLASALKTQGYQVDLLDLCFVNDFCRVIDEYFRYHSPVVIGVTIRNTDDCYLQTSDFFLPKIKQITNHLKLRTNALLVMGGVGFSIMPGAILSYCKVNLGISGDGELIFPELVKRIIRKEDYFSLPGLIWRRNGKFITHRRQYFNLDEVPLLERNFIDNQRYFKEGGQGNIETKRGCNQKCIYCADPVAKGRKIRLRSPKKVVEEIKRLLEWGIDCLHTCDSEFNLPEEHAKAVCEEIIRQKVTTKVKWYTYCSPAPFSEELAKLMKKAGCAGIDFGVDSGSPEMLKRLGRNFGIEEIKNTAQLCHKYRITFMDDLLLGGPGETRETIKETIELMKKISPDRVGVMLGVRVYPGTRLAHIVKDKVKGFNPGFSELSRTEFNPKGLYGDKGNDFLSPTFYLSPALGENEVITSIDEYISNLIGKDERFFFSTKKDSQNYNYNQNQVLIKAIKKGHKGAYWDILRVGK